MKPSTTVTSTVSAAADTPPEPPAGSETAAAACAAFRALSTIVVGAVRLQSRQRICEAQFSLKPQPGHPQLGALGPREHEGPTATSGFCRGPSATAISLTPPAAGGPPEPSAGGWRPERNLPPLGICAPYSSSALIDGLEALAKS